MSYRILLPEKTASGDAKASTAPFDAVSTAAGVSDAFCAQSPQPAAGGGEGMVNTATEEATAAPCAGVWGGVEVGPALCVIVWPLVLFALWL